jgi:hypothetical protein
MYIYDNISLNCFWNDKNLQKKNFRGNENSHFIFFSENEEKYGRARQATEDSKTHAISILN